MGRGTNIDRHLIFLGIQLHRWLDCGRLNVICYLGVGIDKRQKGHGGGSVILVAIVQYLERRDKVLGAKD